jgi:methylmalonyl-CoA mutase
LPTDFSARIARNTQLFLQQESGTTRIIDPWGGSYYVEQLTARSRGASLGAYPGGRELGGMTRAIEAGIPKLKIEEAAARTQARIDSGAAEDHRRERFRAPDEAPIELLKVDNHAVRSQQIEKLERSRRSATGRGRGGARRALELRGVGTGNLLDLAVKAARARRPSARSRMRLEKVWGRHRAEIKAISGVYKQEVGAMSPAVSSGCASCRALRGGRRAPPRILVAKMGQDGARPRSEGDRLRLRGSPASTWTSAPSSPTPRRPPASLRERRPHRGRLVAGRPAT